MERFDGSIIWPRRHAGEEVRNNMRGILITTLGHMHLPVNPSRISLLAVPREANQMPYQRTISP